MTKAQIGKYKKELEFLCTCSKSQRKNFILSRKQKLNAILKCLSYISNTLLYSNKLVSQLTPKERAKLKRHIPALKKLASKLNNNAKTKFIISQKGGNIIQLIWNTLKEIF